MLAATKRLLRQRYACRKTIFLLRQTFCCNKHTKVVFCRDKSSVTTNTCLSRQNTSFVVTKVSLSRQKYVFATKVSLSRQKYVCRDRSMFVATSILLSRQKGYLRQLPPRIAVYIKGTHDVVDIHDTHDAVSIKPTTVPLLTTVSGVAVSRPPGSQVYGDGRWAAPRQRVLVAQPLRHLWHHRLRRVPQRR